MYGDEIKLFVKNKTKQNRKKKKKKKELEILRQIIRIYSPDIGLGFDWKKMCHVNNDRLEKINNGRNRTTILRKN